MNSRYYNPDWGRFINADAIAGNLGELLEHNIFIYCKDNPINWSDNTGLRRERADDGGTTGENRVSSGSYETTVSDELEMTLQNEVTEMRAASMSSLEGVSKAGLTQSQVDEILSIERGTRPDPSTYLSREYKSFSRV